MTNLQKFSMVSIFQKEYPLAYQRLFSLVQERGSEANLRIEHSAITSHYGKSNIIGTNYGITIDLIDMSQFVPREIYQVLCELANCQQENTSLSVCLGYGLRVINPDGSASITAGSHCPLHNTISFDIKTHIQLQKAKDVMIKRFAHEMLHEFNKNEIDVLKDEQSFYEQIALLVNPFITSIYNQLETANANLESRINSIFREGSYECNLLNQLYGTLRLNGYPDLSHAKIEVLNPVNGSMNSIGFL